MPRRPGLDRDQVVQAAIDLLNAQGLAGLSLNRLARALGIQTPSLYNHIDGMPGLLRELALVNARQLGDQLSAAAIGRSGADALFAIAEAYRGYIKANPGLYQASLRTSGTQEQPDEALRQAEERVVSVVLAVTTSFGLTGPDALHAVRGLRSVVHGFATLEAAGGFGLPLDCDESFARLVGMLVKGLETTGQAL